MFRTILSRSKPSDHVVIMNLIIITINYLGSFLYTILHTYFHLSMWERVPHIYTIYLVDEIVGALIFYLIIEPSKKLMYGFFCKLPN